MSEASSESKDTGDFLPIGERAEADGLLREGLRTQAPAILWTENQGRRFKSQLNNRPGPDGSFYALIPEDLDPEQLVAELKKNGSSMVFFSISLSRANIFFKTKFVGYTEEMLQFEPPAKMFKIQRRKDMRLLVRDGYVLRIEFQDPRKPDSSNLRMSAKAYDVSAGGVSFIVHPNEAPIFTDGTKLRAISFTIAGRTITVDGTIRHCKPVRGRDYHKVGVEFARIGAADSQFIAKYVFEENARFVSRFL